jgi:hypothetical protein
VTSHSIPNSTPTGRHEAAPDREHGLRVVDVLEDVCQHNGFERSAAVELLEVRADRLKPTIAEAGFKVVHDLAAAVDGHDGLEVIQQERVTSHGPSSRHVSPWKCRSTTHSAAG